LGHLSDLDPAWELPQLMIEPRGVSVMARPPWITIDKSNVRQYPF
jgi:hypothetical protein